MSDDDAALDEARAALAEAIEAARTAEAARAALAEAIAAARAALADARLIIARTSYKQRCLKLAREMGVSVEHFIVPGHYYTRTLDAPVGKQMTASGAHCCVYEAHDHEEIDGELTRMTPIHLWRCMMDDLRDGLDDCDDDNNPLSRGLRPSAGKG